MSEFYYSNVGFCNSDVGFLQLECRIFTTRIWDPSFATRRTSDFHNSDVGFLLLGYGIFTTRMSDFYYTNVAFLQLAWMSDFYNSDVGFYNLDAGFLQLKWHLQDP